MKLNRKEGCPLLGLLSKSMCVLAIVFISNSVLAEYYVVYSTGEYVVPPPPVMYYQTECPVFKQTHQHRNKHKHIHRKRSHCKMVKKSSAVVTVYSVFNPPCGGPCESHCNPCGQVLMPMCQGCGYKVYSGTPIIHSDSYYMQGIDENDYIDPDKDGNTDDNDIYY
jgi:hypothetical protein